MKEFLFPEDWEILIRLVISVFLGGLIGIERERANHEAGLRTHILVCLGSAGLMVLAILIYGDGLNGDMQRIAAGVVSGIGFLGAGCILINGNRIKGLTTAAGLWTTSCVGMAAGMGYYFLAGSVTALMLMTMLALMPIRRLLHRREKRKDCVLRLHINDRKAFKQVTERIYETEHQIASLAMDEDNVCIVHLSKETDAEANRLVCALMEDEDVLSVERLS